MEQSSMEYETTFLVIGGGIAGVSCVETLLFLCPNEKICLVSESHLIKAVTNLIPIGKFLTKFEVEERNASTLKNVKVLIDTMVKIDYKNQKIITKSNIHIKYAYLCVCTGGQPKLVDENNDCVIGIRDTDSVLNFQKKIKNAKKIALLGNGGIASEIAYEAKNIEIDWIIKDAHVSSTFLDPGAAEFLQNELKTKHGENVKKTTVKRMRYLEDSSSSTQIKRGAALGPDWHRKIDITGIINAMDLPESIRIHRNTEVKLIEKVKNNTEYTLKVELANGEKIFCDFLVSAIGVYPHLNFKCDQELSIHFDGGIEVNEMMQTNLKNIYAAGDVCHANWSQSENWFQMRLWTQARQMGSMAGKSMASHHLKEEIYQDFCFELFGHVTELFGKQIVLLGNYNGQKYEKNYEILLRMTPGAEYIKFVIKDGKLKGAILIGDTGLEETCENLILNKIDITPFGDDILNPDIDIEDYFD